MCVCVCVCVCVMRIMPVYKEMFMAFSEVLEYSYTYLRVFLVCVVYIISNLFLKFATGSLL